MKKRLEEIEARLKAATPEPWSYDSDENEIHADTMQDFGGDPVHICEMMGSSRIDNSSFIANAPTDIRDLLAVVKLQRKALKRYICPICRGGKDYLESMKCMKYHSCAAIEACDKILEVK